MIDEKTLFYIFIIKIIIKLKMNQKKYIDYSKFDYSEVKWIINFLRIKKLVQWLFKDISNYKNIKEQLDK